MIRWLVFEYWFNIFILEICKRLFMMEVSYIFKFNLIFKIKKLSLFMLF